MCERNLIICLCNALLACWVW